MIKAKEKSRHIRSITKQPLCITKFCRESCCVWFARGCEDNFEQSNSRVKPKNHCVGSEQAAKLVLDPHLTIMNNLLTFPGPGWMPTWMPLLDICMAISAYARVTAHFHLSFLARTPCSEKVCHVSDTNTRESSDPHTDPNPSTWELLLACTREFDLAYSI